MQSDKPSAGGRNHLIGLTLGALGVVYGDIGTSPLYTMRECFNGPHAMAVNHDNVLGILSLITWALVSIVSIKYLGFILRADNKGEGGILSLMALSFSERGCAEPGTRLCRTMVLLGLFGTALLYGDGVITPAVSVLGAMEGLTVATPRFEPYIVPLTVIIFVVLFSVQRFGTGAVGRVFGAVTLVWFVSIAALGMSQIIHEPRVLQALSPHHAARFFIAHGWGGFVVLGAVFLAVTGAEALYADMGHFGRKPIRLAWFSLVLPSLLLNYFGQGAELLRNAASAENPFYHMAPKWALYPLVMLATAAAVIASQALISGAFSLTMQAVQLGYLPRLKIDHTSRTERGQVYIGPVNWFLMCACIALVVSFQTSGNLAAAYGIAVTLTMLITTLLFDFAARRLFGWSRAKAFLICLPFFLIEFAFFSANVAKIRHGGWLPLLIGAVGFTLFTTWKTGRQILGRRLRDSTLPLEIFLADLATNAPQRVKGTAVYLAGRTGVVPISLLHNLKHNRVLHETVLIVTAVGHEQAYVDDERRLEFQPLEHGFYRVVGHYGYMEEADIPRLLERCEAKKFKVDVSELSYFLSKETILPSPKQGMTKWREQLFALMSRNALSAASFFKLPPNRVVELGMQVEI